MDEPEGPKVQMVNVGGDESLDLSEEGEEGGPGCGSGRRRED